MIDYIWQALNTRWMDLNFFQLMAWGITWVLILMLILLIYFIGLAIYFKCVDIIEDKTKWRFY